MSPLSLFSLFLFLSFFASLGCAIQTEHSLKLSEPWSLGARAHSSERIQLHFGLKQQKTDELERILFDVSSPSSPNYGKHLSFEQVNELVTPSEESFEVVLAWLSSHHIQAEENHNGDMLRVDVTIEQAEALLNAEYHRIHHASTDASVLRAVRYSVPQNVAAHLDFVGPTTRLPLRPHVRYTQQSAEALFNTPKTLRALYNVGSASSQSPQNQLAVTGFLEQYISPDDLQKFFTNYDPPSVGREANIVGPNVPDQPGVEASLDIQYSMALGVGVNSTFWSTAGRAPNNKENEPFLAFLFDVSNSSDVPQIFSISYGDNEDTVDIDYATRVSVEFQKGGARGITFLASSGDGGVAGGQSSGCKKFVPTFPAASPYITAVGGTQGSNPEQGWSYSSGGFSNYWSPPSYQTSFISKYFSTAQNLPPQGDYNQAGAGFPDISAQAVNFLVVLQGNSVPVAGTSCASPTVAGIVALLNDIRLSAGKSVLGYLNPLFYENSNAFNDITSGNNAGCGTNGFYAAEGWDPITGLGTPNFGTLADIVKHLP